MCVCKQFSPSPWIIRFICCKIVLGFRHCYRLSCLMPVSYILCWLYCKNNCLYLFKKQIFEVASFVFWNFDNAPMVWVRQDAFLPVIGVDFYWNSRYFIFIHYLGHLRCDTMTQNHQNGGPTTVDCSHTKIQWSCDISHTKNISTVLNLCYVGPTAI